MAMAADTTLKRKIVRQQGISAKAEEEGRRWYNYKVLKLPTKNFSVFRIRVLMGEKNLISVIPLILNRKPSQKNATQIYILSVLKVPEVWARAACLKHVARATRP